MSSLTELGVPSHKASHFLNMGMRKEQLVNAPFTFTFEALPDNLPNNFVFLVEIHLFQEVFPDFSTYL